MTTTHITVNLENKSSYNFIPGVHNCPHGKVGPVCPPLTSTRGVAQVSGDTDDNGVLNFNMEWHLEGKPNDQFDTNVEVYWKSDDSNTIIKCPGARGPIVGWTVDGSGFSEGQWLLTLTASDI